MKAILQDHETTRKRIRAMRIGNCWKGLLDGKMAKGGEGGGETWHGEGGTAKRIGVLIE